MKNRYHTLIIGSGCAGYATAERLHSLGITDIAVITEGINMGTSRNTGSDKQTYYKLSLCGSEGDSVREMAQTLYSGGGVMGEHALCEAAYSTRCFMHLVELGVPFPTNDFGEYVGYKTDHDPRSRATSCGPLTSKYMTAALEAAVISKNIEIIDNQRVIKMITESGCVTGIACVNTQSGEISVIACRCCVLATGGPACVYKQVVYPESQHGATSLAIDAWAPLSNMEEWQYGIASTRFRWNLSGSYQQVLPRYVSVSPDGEEKELLFEALGDRSLELTFLKGYEWPFDSRKLEGSSAVDLLVFEEIKKGNRVFLDYTRNPRGLENGLSALPDYLYDYLKNSDALGDTPIKRLEKMRDELNLTIEKLKERTQKKGDIIKEITIEPQTVYCRVYNATSVADKTNLLRDTALEAMRLYETDTRKRLYFTEYSSKSPMDINYCVAIPDGCEGEYVKVLPELKGISFFHHGAYEDIPEARKKLISYAKENNKKLSGVFRNVYLEGPPQHKDPSKFITQIIALID